MSSFIERMRVIANDTETVNKTYADEYQKKKEARKDQLFKSLTFKYYGPIKKAIEFASKYGRQYAYMNFDRDDFKANFNGLGTPAQFQRLWLQELCNPDSKYLELHTWPPLKTDSNWMTTIENNTKELIYTTHRTPRPLSSNSAFANSSTMQKRDSFQGLNFDVWNNAKFTTVFSWDVGINQNAMCHYHTRHWTDNNNFNKVKDTTLLPDSGDEFETFREKFYVAEEAAEKAPAVPRTQPPVTPWSAAERAAWEAPRVAERAAATIMNGDDAEWRAAMATAWAEDKVAEAAEAALKKEREEVAEEMRKARAEGDDDLGWAAAERAVREARRWAVEEREAAKNGYRRH